MSNPPSTRRRPSVHITLQLVRHGCIGLCGSWPRVLALVMRSCPTWESVCGRSTRVLQLLKRCGVKVRHRVKQYTLLATAEQAEGRLPFPDPQSASRRWRSGGLPV